MRIRFVSALQRKSAAASPSLDSSVSADVGKIARSFSIFKRDLIARRYVRSCQRRTTSVPMYLEDLSDLFSSGEAERWRDVAVRFLSSRTRNQRQARYRDDVAGYLAKFPPTRIAAVGGKRAWQLEDCEILRDSQRRSKEERGGSRRVAGGRRKVS